MPQISTISSTISGQVGLGTGDYSNRLTITNTGFVQTQGNQQTSVYGYTGQPVLSNFGIILGGPGNTSPTTYEGGTGGYGAGFNYGTIYNSGLIQGGTGGYGIYLGGTGGRGGRAESGVTVINAGTLAGGTGGANYQNNGGGAGGSGFELEGTATLTNLAGGTLNGGAGGYSTIAAPGKGGYGAGLYFGASLYNAGILAGGTGGGGLATAGNGGEGASVNDGTLVNTGTIIGGPGGQQTTGNFSQGYGGDGIYLQAGQVTNAAGGLVQGGTGGSQAGTYKNVGVVITGGSFANAGNIAGGAGAYGKYSGGRGGDGARLYAGTLNNYGTISGGSGAYALYYGAEGGAGLRLYGGLLGNYGVITGGAGGGNNNPGMYSRGGSGAGGTGIYLGPSPGVFAFTNAVSGIISGGAGGFSQGDNSAAGGSGAYVTGGNALYNKGNISGGAGSGNNSSGSAGNGGIGAYLKSNGALINAGTITGGTGGGAFYSQYSQGSNSSGGAGANAFYGQGSNTSTGLITGGAGGNGTNPEHGGAGGVGLQLHGGSFANAGNIAGGTGSNGIYSPGNGGDGVDASYAATFNNSGNIAGGNASSVIINGGGQGGAGIYIASHAKVTNAAGAGVTGGNGGYSFAGNGGNGGAGVLINGGLFTNAGTITGGSGGGTGESNFLSAGSAGNSVQFGNNIGTLVVDPGAVFKGNVVANNAVADVLILGAGTSIGYLGGFGTQITNFTDISFGRRAAWTLAGTYTAFDSTQTITGFNYTDTLVLDGFTADGSTYVAGVGLELTSAGNTITLDINTQTFAVYANGGNTTIDVGNTANYIITTISNTVDNSVTLNTGHYINYLTVTNTGLVAATANGTTGIYSIAAYGPATLSNYGLITGANSTNDNGGDGANLASGSITNAGRISGGSGVSGPANGDIGGNGGNGAALGLGTISNTGFITGGNGGNGDSGQAGGQGGDGVDLGTATLANDGYITGGNGGYGSGGFPGGNGGAGVYLAAGLLTNAGTISGGSGGSGFGGGRAGNAVQFGTGAATLVVDPGAVFNGNVMANAGVADALVLGSGSSYGVLTGLGVQFSNFTDISFATGAGWYVAGNNTAFDSGQTITGFSAADTLVLDGFTADGSTYVAGIGLELTSAGSTITLAINPEIFAANTLNGDTVIETAITTISTTINNGVALYTGHYINYLSITNTGLVSGSGGGNAVFQFGNPSSNHGYPGNTGVNIAAGTLLNSGSLTGGSGGSSVYQSGGPGGAGGAGVEVTGGSLSNYSTGMITGGTGGFGLYGGGTGGAGIYFNGGIITNAGTISGGSGGGNRFSGSAGNSGDAIDFGTAAATLVVDYGAIFNGNVIANTLAADTLVLGDPPGQGTITGLGTEFQNFSTIDFSAGSSWDAIGTYTAFSTGQTITGFVPGDTIDLQGFTASSIYYESGAGLVLNAGTQTITLAFNPDLGTDSFLATDTANGTEVTIPICYLHGTKILTPAGEIAIEDLAIGDTVVTKFGGYQRIKWIGRQNYQARFLQHNRAQWPVCIRQHALGENLPRRDLYVSPGHSMLINGILVLAKALVNGVSITQNQPAADIHYVQLEFDNHDCVLAENTWSESYADIPGWRAKYHNAAAFYALYPDHIEPAQHIMCAPRPEQGPLLEAALAPITARAVVVTKPGYLRGWVDHAKDGIIEGWAQDTAQPQLPVLLEIVLGGRVLGTALACGYREDLAQAGIGQGWCQFSFALPSKTPRKLAQNLQVRRAADKTALPLTSVCQAELGIKTATARRKTA